MIWLLKWSRQNWIIFDVIFLGYPIDQWWIFFRIRGYSIREKFPILGTSGKSFQILWSARIVGYCHSRAGKPFLVRETLPERKPFLDRETFLWQVSISLQGKPLLSGKHFPARETFLGQVNISLKGKPFSGRDLVIPFPTTYDLEMERKS